MEAWLIQQWQRNSPWQLLLRPISWLFGLLTAIRRFAFRIGLLKSRAVGVPVIIVGNITVGGTGKTPLVLALVEALTKRGKQCGIVTRGYQRGANSSMANAVHVVSASAQSPVVSDEATLLARRSGAPVYAGVNRVAVAQTLLRDHPKVDVIVCDDGLQHYAMKRDIELCVIDGLRGLGNEGLIPAGPLREPVSRLQTVNAIVVNRSGSQGDMSRFSPSTPAFAMTLGNEHFVNLKTEQQISIEDALVAFRKTRIHALAGIGNPQRFFLHLINLGFPLTSTRPFVDHHQYRDFDMPGLEAGVILMTEKDAVKCAVFADERMWFMRVDAVLPNDFTDFILNNLPH